MIKLSRRSFFKGAAAVAGAAVVAPFAAASEVMNIYVEHGFTWFIKDKIEDKPFRDLVSTTLAKHNKLISENFQKNNAFMVTFKGKPVRINVEKISPELQMERMKEKFAKRYTERNIGNREVPRYNYCDDIEQNIETQEYFPGAPFTNIHEKV